MIPNILSSSFSTYISLIILAPYFIACSAIWYLYVSIEIIIFGNNFRISIKVGNNLFPSSFNEIALEPGLEDAAPKSIMSTPSSIISFTLRIDFSIWIENIASSSNYIINKAVAKEYYNQILKLKKDIGLKDNVWTMTPFKAKSTDILTSLLKMPEVIKKSENKSDSNDWDIISTSIDGVINDLIKYRLDEGEKLKQDIHLRIKNIHTSLNEINPFAKKRIEEVKKNLSNKLDKLDFNHFDENRLEQELIYYLEKQDITEEQVRLSSHLEYFLDTIKKNTPNGKKLTFIAQEIGREINTIGAKSYDSEMQKIVVNMKDELEKIKEQLLNIL